MSDTTELKVGFVTLLGVFLFTLAVFSIKDLSLKRRNYGYLKIEFENVRGLSNSSLVYLQGVKIGKVTHISHNLENRVVATLEIQESFAQGKIREDCQFTIHAVGAISNEKYIDISPPINSQSPYFDLLTNTPHLKGESLPGFSEVLEHARNILKTLDERGILAILGEKDQQASATALLKYLTDTGENFSQISRRFNSLLEKHQSSLDEFFENGRSLSRKLENLSQKFEGTLDASTFKGILEKSKEISQNLAILTGSPNRGKIDQILDNARSLSERIDLLVTELVDKNQISSEITGAVGAFRESAKNVQEISEKVKGIFKNNDLENNLEDSLKSAKNMAVAVDQIYENISQWEVNVGYFLKIDGGDTDIKSDLFMEVHKKGNYLYHLGVEDIGEKPQFDLIIEEKKKRFGKRGGIIASKVGFGLFNQMSNRLRVGFDIFDTVSPKIRFEGTLKVTDHFDLRFRADQLNRRQDSHTESGLQYRF